MSKLTSYAERLKLAHLMNVSAESLAFMDRLPADATAAFRRQVSNTLFDTNQAMFQRIAASSRLLPVPLLTVIAQKAIGPWLSAHVAGHMPTDRAIDMARRLPVPFLADVCVGIDPRRVRHIIQGIPIELSLKVALELVQRRDFITMGRFIDALPDSTLLTLLKGMQDDEALLMIAFYVEDRSHLDHIIGLIPDERIDRVIRVAQQKGLWPQALALMRFVSPASCRRLGDIAMRHDDATLDGMIVAAEQFELLSEVLPILSFMSEAAQRRFMNVARADDPVFLQSIVEIARELALWPQLLPLLRLKDNTRAFSSVVGTLGEAVLREIMVAASDYELWTHVLDQVQHFEEEQQATLALALARANDREMKNLMQAVQQHDRWQQLVDIASGMSADMHSYLIENGIAQDDNVASRLVKAAEQAGIWDDALRVLTEQADLLVRLLERLPEPTQHQLLQAALQLDAELIDRLSEAASRAGAWDVLLRVLDGNPELLREKLPVLMQGISADQQSELRRRAETLGLEQLLD